ncbi:glycoside hydrolase family 113 [Hymenobacter jejuensis]|uniref:GTA TIM-barrel-like domain-containing protein n=1 Tax=Hymenobacter jejuensis TaxID=2502781 RepID=A0A5B7ZWL9_9BACT|nr:hypothetical protein [Hymenobacter jejuensis]QDA59005.1 hypothetical protein FHG12_02310 [Hymenobacter jejuensis]
MRVSLVVRRFWWLVPAVLLVGAARWWWKPHTPTADLSAAPAPTAPNPSIYADGRLRGVSWVGGDSVTDADLEPLIRNHVTWMVQTPFGWQRGATSPEIGMNTGVGNRGYWGESDRGLAYTAQLARQHGIRTMLKPHLWVQGSGGSWPGDVQMQSAADWQAWFANYTRFVLHYAQLAEREHFDALCLGTELLHASTEHEAEWRTLIQQVRKVYRGPLTYAANWSGEYEKIRFWDALDFIGIQAYFPLSQANSPAKATLLAGWKPHLAAIERLQKRFNKPIIFTEAGYKTTADAAVEPWKWPDNMAVFASPDEQTQAACYEALFETFWSKPWFKGLFVWKWYPGLAADGPARRHLDFTPQHKPAEQVMARWYGR